MKNKLLAVQLAGFLSLGLISTAAFAQNTVYRADRISTQGRVTSVIRQGDMYQVTLNHGGYTYLVPVSTVNGRTLQVGDHVRIDGLVNGEVVNSDMLALQGEPAYVTDPAYRTVPYGSSGWMTGTVQRVDRHLGYLVIKDDATGIDNKIDVRHMDLRKPVNVWGIKAGDHISVSGSWENRQTFNATRIEY
jgi:hypothetical protein